MKRLVTSARLILAGLAVAATLGQSPAEAGTIGIGAFSGVETVINFDGLAGSSILGSGEVVTNQYAGLGATFANATATANTFLATLIPAASLPNVVFVDQGGGGNLPPLSILFSVPVNRVGLDFGSSLSSFLTMAAYDSTNALIETQDFVGQSIPIGLGGFAGLQETANIARLDVSYHPNSAPAQTFNYAFDNLRFEATTSTVPEPTSLLLLGTGLVGAARAWRKRRA